MKRFLLIILTIFFVSSVFGIHNPKRFRPMLPNFLKFGKVEKTDTEKKSEPEVEEDTKRYIQTLEQNVQILEVIIDKLEKDLEKIEKERKKKEEPLENLR
ncbi:MAG: hypothetical protein SFU98_03820 [Leptospiraceae bacterium]|nr:hypothetical protein [Leptospiraceae bacterium]